MSDSDPDDKFTVHRGDLRLTKPGVLNPHGYSFSTLPSGRVVYYDDNGQPVADPLADPAADPADGGSDDAG
jgi:hypothetical protein